MTCFANGSAVALFYCQEDVNGEIHATTPAFKPIRFVSAGLNVNTAQIDSDEIRPDRQTPPSRSGNYSILGNIAGEAAFGAHDDLLEAAMQGTWSAGPSLAGITISADGDDDSFNDSGNGFVTAGFQVGDLITTSGFTGDAGNNGTWKIATVAAGKITVTNADGTPATAIVDDAAGEAVTVAAAFEVVKIGSTRRTFAILERHTDKNLDYIYRGCEVNGMTLNMPLGGKAGITFPVVGKEAETYAVPVGATFAARTSTDMMVTTEGELLLDGASVGYATELNMVLANGQEAAFALFQRAAFCVTNGIARVTGTLSFYLVDGTLWDRYLSEDEQAVRVKVQGPTGYYVFMMPRTKFPTGTKETNGPGAIIPTLNISAGYDDTAGTTLSIQRSL